MGEITSKKVAVYKDGILKGIFKSASALERESVEALGVKLLQSVISLVCLGEEIKI